MPCEYLYPHYQLEAGYGHAATAAQSRDMEGYASLENFLPWTWLQLKLLEWRRPMTITLNDSFGMRPSPIVTRHVKRKLEEWFPTPSPYERTKCDGRS